MWELNYKESWALKNWFFWTVVLEKTLENPLDCKKIKSVNPKGNQSWIFIGRTDAEAKAPILWPPDAKSQLIRKDPDAGKDWRQEEKRMRGWEGWMAWVWASSGKWWRTGVFQSVWSQSWTWLSTEQHLDKILILEKIAMPYNFLLICDFPLYLSGLFSQIQSFALWNSQLFGSCWCPPHIFI